MANVFNIGISALLTSQRQPGTTSHNIANVNTEGFSRQRTELEQLRSHHTGGLFFGSGVRAAEITRSADQFLVNQLRSANSNEDISSEPGR